jgi:hypothetical protein
MNKNTTCFIGANDTIHIQFKWMLLFMAYYPDLQRRMRDEIKNNIGTIKYNKFVTHSFLLFYKS